MNGRNKKKDTKVERYENNSLRHINKQNKLDVQGAHAQTFSHLYKFQMCNT